MTRRVWLVSITDENGDRVEVWSSQRNAERRATILSVENADVYDFRVSVRPTRVRTRAELDAK